MHRLDQVALDGGRRSLERREGHHDLERVLERRAIEEDGRGGVLQDAGMGKDDRLDLGQDRIELGRFRDSETRLTGIGSRSDRN